MDEAEAKLKKEEEELIAPMLGKRFHNSEILSREKVKKESLIENYESSDENDYATSENSSDDNDDDDYQVAKKFKRKGKKASAEKKGKAIVKKNEKAAGKKEKKKANLARVSVLALKSNDNKVVIMPKKEEAKKTLVEIIEDSKSGLPAKSEIESRERRALLKKATG